MTNRSKVDKQTTFEKAWMQLNNKISINYASKKENWKQDIVKINDIFLYSVVIDIIRNKDNSEP